MLRCCLALALLAPCWSASDWGETLIVAANQRILCQKITKELVLVAQDIEGEKAKADLRITMQQFNTDLSALINGDSARHILPATADLVKKDLQKVTDAWLVYQALLVENIDTVRDPVTNEVNYTVITLALDYNKPIVKYSEEVVKLLVAQSVVAGEDGSAATLVDICERQLMLVHELNKEVVLVAMGVKPEYYLESLIPPKVLSSMQLFQTSHEGILQGATWANVVPLRQACVLDQMRVVTKDWGSVLPKLQMVTTSPSIEDAQQKATEIALNLTVCCDQLVGSMMLATYSIAHGVTTCGDLKAEVSAEEWLVAIQSSEAQNYLVAQATQLFMQIALGFEVSQSQVDLTVLTESVGQDLRKLIEGSIAEQLRVPPDQAIVDLLFAAQEAWIDLETELKKSVRSANIPSTSIKEVARLSRLALDNMGSAVTLYVKVALSSGTDAPVYLLDIASAQRTALAKLAKETSLLSYGYDPQNSWIRFNYTRQSFVDNHWKLLKGYPASGYYPVVPKTTNICIIQQMSAVLTAYEVLEIAALEVANGDGQRLQEVVKRTPEVVAEMEVAMNQFSGLNTTCGPVSFSKEQWQGLISEVGQLRSLSQQAAVRFILQSEFNQTTVSLSTKLEESELRIKFGNRDPLVPPPISQAMFDEVALHLEPKLHALVAALAGSDAQQVNDASVALTEETKLVKKEFLQDALVSNPDMPVLRMDLASQQIMLSYRIFKESLMLKANLNSTAAYVTTSIGDFETAQNHLKTGGNGIPPVIRNRFDIFRQWDKVMASWSVFKELILSGAGSISETQMALDNLVLDLELALELYTIPDEPLRADTVWPIVAYSAIGVFVVFVACCACLVFCSLRKKKDKETAEV